LDRLCREGFWVFSEVKHETGQTGLNRYFAPTDMLM
jgi:hypothetical protein